MHYLSKTIDAGQLLFANPNSVSYTAAKATCKRMRRSSVKLMRLSDCHVPCSHHHVERSLTKWSVPHGSDEATSALAEGYGLGLHLNKCSVLISLVSGMSLMLKIRCTRSKVELFTV